MGVGALKAINTFPPPRPTHPKRDTPELCAKVGDGMKG
jgi:hypothetical protein